MNQWASESQWCNCSMNRWITGATNERINGSTIQWIPESVSQWINESVSPWINAFFRPYLPKVLQPFSFLWFFFRNRTIATVLCTFCWPHLPSTFCRPDLPKVLRAFQCFNDRNWIANPALAIVLRAFCRQLSGFAPKNVFTREFTWNCYASQLLGHGWLTWWCECWPWPSSVTLKFSN